VFNRGEVQLAGEKIGDRLGVVAQALDAGRDRFLILARLLLGGAQATSIE
jgi:hypothetical protein